MLSGSEQDSGSLRIKTFRYLQNKCQVGVNGKIVNRIANDIDEVLWLYQSARDLQTEKAMVVWPIFDKMFIQNEIEEQRQWKLNIANSIACNWAITFEVKEIWREKEKGDAIYIHRIATHPAFRGQQVY